MLTIPPNINEAHVIMIIPGIYVHVNIVLQIKYVGYICTQYYTYRPRMLYNHFYKSMINNIDDGMSLVSYTSSYLVVAISLQSSHGACGK